MTELDTAPDLGPKYRCGALTVQADGGVRRFGFAVTGRNGDWIGLLQPDGLLLTCCIAAHGADDLEMPGVAAALFGGEDVPVVQVQFADAAARTDWFARVHWVRMGRVLLPQFLRPAI